MRDRSSRIWQGAPRQSTKEETDLMNLPTAQQTIQRGQQ
jgi:hypothetical protein